MYQGLAYTMSTFLWEIFFGKFFFPYIGITIKIVLQKLIEKWSILLDKQEDSCLGRFKEQAPTSLDQSSTDVYQISLDIWCLQT